jgi:hypothetical protein
MVQLPGVSIQVKGFTRGASTNAEGKYTLSASANETLVFSFIGVQSQEVKVRNSSTINITMKSNTSELNEVVVTAFGIEKEKRTLGYATTGNTFFNPRSNQFFSVGGQIENYTVNYDRWLNLTVAGRNDVTSTLQKASRSFFYPSASLAVVFSDLLGINPKILTLGKLRASVAETAKDISPYGSQSVYNRQPTSGLGYGFTNNNPYIVSERQRTF